MKKYVKYDNIEYFMPFLYCNDLYIPLLEELLKGEINPVKYVYGSPHCMWQGGRQTSVKIHTLTMIDNYIKCLKARNLIPTFTFTNINEIEDKLNDEYSNNLLDVVYNNDAHIIVATDILYKHIKSRYPEAKLHCSVINPIIKIIEDKNFDETRFYNEMLDKYEIVVVRPEYVIENINKLDKILSDISRIEILVNQHCQYNCQLHKDHYIIINKSNDYYFSNKKVTEDEIKLSMQIHEQCPKSGGKEYKSVCMTDEQVSRLIDIGVKKIKLQGRHKSFDILFDDLYQHFFNKDIPKEEIRSKIDLICARMVQNNKKISILYAMN